MNKTVEVPCYECGYGNEIDLSLYGWGDHIGLYHKCDECENIFAFDVEICLKTVSFDAKWV